MQAVQDAKHHTTKVYGFGPWLPDRMDSSVLPMMLCVQAVQDAKHHTTKVYGFGPWLPDRMDSSLLPMVLCMRW
jgi:hypothetical protein